MTTELVAFLDESRKPIRNPATRRVGDHGRKHYVVAAAVVIGGDISNIRSQLRQVEAGLGYPLHYRELSTARRVKALGAIDGIDGWDGYLYETARPLPDAGYSEHHVRAKVIEQALTHLSSQGVVEAVLETRAGTNRRFLLLTTRIMTCCTASAAGNRPRKFSDQPRRQNRDHPADSRPTRRGTLRLAL